MKKKNSTKSLKTDWKWLQSASDDDLNYDDVKPLEAQFFSKAQLKMPEPKPIVTLRLDADVLRWFRSKGKGYQTRINAILRMYMLAQK